MNSSISFFNHDGALYPPRSSSNTVHTIAGRPATMRDGLRARAQATAHAPANTCQRTQHDNDLNNIRSYVYSASNATNKKRAEAESVKLCKNKGGYKIKKVILAATIAFLVSVAGIMSATAQQTATQLTATNNNWVPRYTD